MASNLRYCPVCGEGYEDMAALSAHENSHSNSSTASNLQHCEVCGAGYEDMTALSAHQNTHRNINEGYGCHICQATFSEQRNLSRHFRTIHGHRHQHYCCNKCKAEFNSKYNKIRHEKSCGKAPTTFDCPVCCKKLTTKFRLTQHMSKHTETNESQRPTTDPLTTSTNSVADTSGSNQCTKGARKNRKTDERTKSYTCRRCSSTFPDRRRLHVHQMSEHYQSGSGKPLQDRPFNDDNSPFLNPDGTIDQELRDNYEVNAPIILEPNDEGPVVSRYNVPVALDLDIDRVMDAAEEIYSRQRHSFRINLSFGIILRNVVSGEYRYFRPYSNADVLPQPMLIVTHEDLSKLRRQLNSMSLIDHIMTQRPNTSWKPVLVTNIVFHVYSTNFVVGKGGVNLPSFIKNHKALVSLQNNKNTAKPFDDNLCAFRCLSLHRGFDVNSLEKPTKLYFREWVTYSRSVGNTVTSSAKDFAGLEVNDLPDFETCYNVNVNVMMLTEDRTAQSVYVSRCRFKGEPLYINLHENHFSFIKKIKMFSNRYQCFTCDRLFDQINNLKRHEPTCSDKTVFRYPGGFFQPPQTLFEKLENIGINVPENSRTYEYFIVYDFESMLQKVQIQTSPHLQWTQEHIPISVSICSNVPDFTEPRCIVEPELNSLVSKMVDEMRSIADRAKELAKEKWGWVKEELKLVMQALDDDDDVDDDDADDDESGAESEGERETEESEIEREGEASEKTKKRKKDTPEQKGRMSVKRQLNRIYGQLKGYIKQVPVLGFNSAKYDMNLIKKKLARFLEMHTEEGAFVVKRNNAYTCVVSDQFRYLDVTQFLAPGTSYEQFLKAYNSDQAKGYFPYEYLDDISKLDETSLPPHEAFFSTLKNANITDEQYEYCQKIWRDNDMTTLRDFLEWYNNLDVGPFVTAIENFQVFYFQKKLDVFKTAISVPGMARQMLFKAAKKAGASFSLFDEKNKDLYETVKNNIIGGPSVIFCRHAKTGETYIRNNPQKPCRRIRGDDANALYLWAIGQALPTGPFIRRRHDNDFKPERRDKWMSAYHWMNYLNSTDEVDIRHKMNYGTEKRVGQYPVDGWNPTTNTIYQFQGCYFHGHDCDVTRDIRDATRRQCQADKLKKTLDTTNYLRSQGYTVIEKWECEFIRDCKNDPILKSFIKENTPTFVIDHPSKVTETQILNGVRDGTLFGLVEVDIEVTDQWEGSFKKNMAPYDYFAEMSPLFCTTDVPFEVIGKHMQEHVQNFNLSQNSRRLLIGGMKGQQMLIATPLLRWYLSHGMKVTRVYQVVEYQPKTCFKEFVKEISDARRCGDISPDKAIIADTNKLIGNSSYGSLIMDKTKHRKVKYVQGEREVCLLVNNPLFRKLDCLEPEEQYYEVEMAKSKITLDLPIQLGYFILQYAKLRMLQYYYDFLDAYVDRSNFEYLEMDTDSAYYAISGHTLGDVIKPDMRQQYLRGLQGFCDREEVEADCEYHWFPRTCCPRHAKYDKRTPGLFKLEYEGDEMIGLCSKTYIVRKSKIVRPSLNRLVAYRLLRSTKRLKPRRLAYVPYASNVYKLSSKGISKRYIKAPMSIFRSVLNTKKSHSGTNRGFRVRNNTIFTYTQERYGFTYYYCKREVLQDGIHTVPLKLTLCPIPTKNDETVTDDTETREEEGMDTNE